MRYNCNDILDLELKYANDNEVMDIIKELKDIYEEVKEIRKELERAYGRVSDAEEELKVVKEDLYDAIRYCEDFTQEV